MQLARIRAFVVAAACLSLLAGCLTTANHPDPLTPGADPEQTGAVTEITGAVEVPAGSQGATPELLGSDPKDDLSLAKNHFRKGAFGLAEQHYRKAVELNPRDAEAWVGLAASYDRLRRFDLADRAYQQAIKIIGPTPELLNNQGFSYMLRGDYRRARSTLLAARRKSPNNPYINSNLELLDEAQRKAKGIN